MKSMSTVTDRLLHHIIRNFINQYFYFSAENSALTVKLQFLETKIAVMEANQTGYEERLEKATTELLEVKERYNQELGELKRAIREMKMMYVNFYLLI